MLVLSRKKNQRFAIGSEITITVLEIDGNRVRLGIEADRNIPVLREELATNAAPRLPVDQAARAIT